MKNKKILAVLVAVSMVLQGCATLFPTQRMIDDILPNNNRHFYCDADLIPYSKQELTNATILYGQELSEYYFLHVNEFDENIVDEVDEDKKEEFMARLTYMNSNYKLLKARYEKYAGEEGATKDDFKKVDSEFNKFYKLPNSVFSETVKSNNANKLAGSPEISIRIDVNTLTNNDIYYEADAKVYKHVTLPKKQYEKMKIGQSLVIDVPEKNGDEENTAMRKATLVLIASDSFIEYYDEEKDEEIETDDKTDEDSKINAIEDTIEESATTSDATYEDSNGLKKSKDTIYYVAPNDVLSSYRKLVNADGEVIEQYIGKEKVQILKDARIAKGIDETRVVTQILTEAPGTKNYTINQISDAHEGGGYIDEDFKEEIYLNCIYTNLKGYITSGYHYMQMYIDNQYARENNTKYQSEQKVETKTNDLSQNDIQNYDENSLDNFDENIEETMIDDIENSETENKKEASDEDNNSGQESQSN